MGEWLEVGREGRTDGRREEGRVIGRVNGWRDYYIRQRQDRVRRLNQHIP